MDTRAGSEGARTVTAAHRGLAVALVLLGVAAFSVNAGVSRLVLDHGVPPSALAAVRSLGAALLLAAVIALWPRGRWRIDSRDRALLIPYGIVGLSLMPLLYFEAIARIPIGLALLLEYLAPLWVALWARFVRKQRVTALLWPAIVLTTAGLAVVAGAGLQGLDPWGIAAGLACSVAFAAYFLLGERLVVRNDPVVVTFWGFGVSAVAWTAIGAVSLTAAWWRIPAADSVALVPALTASAAPLILLLAWIVLLGTVVPFGAETAAMRFIPATAVSILATGEPIGAAVVAWWLFDEVLTALQLFGAALVIIGIVLALLSLRQNPPAASVASGTRRVRWLRNSREGGPGDR